MYSLTSLLLVVCIVATSSFVLKENSELKNARNDYERIDCYPEAPYSFGEDIKDKCLARNCKFEYSSIPNVPWCYFPQESFGYTMKNSKEVENGYEINLARISATKSPFPEPVENLVLSMEFLNSKAINLKIKDADNERYEVPLDLNNIRSTNPNENLKDSSEFEFKFGNRQGDNMFWFQIVRKSNGAVLFDTSIGSFVYNNQFLQIATKLPAGSNVYGFGENNHPTLSHDFNYKLWGMFARDQPNVAAENANQYGVQPFYNVLESDGKSHGVLLVNSNAMEYSFTPNPALVLRSIGGIFDFYFFSGPEPEAVVKQYTSLVGFPIMIPYFSLGFQLSRWEYKNLDDMKKIVQRNLDAGIPLDIQYADIEHFQNQMDFTISRENFKDLPAYFKDLQSKGMHTVIILDPALVIDRGNLNYKPYLSGVQEDIYIKWPKGISPDYNETQSDIMLGYCWPDDKVAYPDFFHPAADKWWTDLIVEYRKANISFDALWIDMNEPAVFDTNEEKPWNWPDDKLPYWTLKCPKNSLEDPPYRTINAFRYDQYNKKARLSQNTLCMSGLQTDGNRVYNHYDVHSLYGLSESIITQKAARLATGKRSFVLTRSTFIGSGRYSGHWLGDNDSSFKDLHRSIIGMIEYGLFGIPYVGADICGFTSTSNEELCTRWQQLGAFYPYSRNHNVRGEPDQDPAAFSQQLIDAAKKALEIRYTILPLYYTLFFRAHTTGSLVMKGLYQEFPYDKNARTIDTQFMIGSSILVSPVVENGARSVKAYFPLMNNWYNYYNGELVADQGFKLLSAPLSHVNVHVRGGSIIPTQEPANNTVFSRKNPFGLIVALDEFDTARGELFYDDGDSITSIEAGEYFLSKFTYENDELEMTVEKNGWTDMADKTLNTIRLFGLANKKRVTKSSLEIQVVTSSGTNQAVDFVLTDKGEVKLLNLNLKITENFKIIFKANPATVTLQVNDPVELYDLNKRVDCYPEQGASEQNCRNRKCSWYPSFVSNIPWCFIDQKRVGYVIDESQTINPQIDQSEQRKKATYGIKKVDDLTYYGEDMNKLKIQVEHKGSKMVRIKFTDQNNPNRYEVPVSTTWDEKVDETREGKVTDNDLEVKVESDNLGRFVFEVYRKSTGARLISTREYAEAYVFSDRYIQLYTRLATENVYGFGENSHESFRHKFKEGAPAYPIFARDEPPQGIVQALYGTQPFYMLIEDDGSAHGLFIMNSNAQEYKFSALKTFMYRTLGGILDIYMFSGPTPEDVIKQYTSLIGRPQLPPYHALGFQLSRYGFNTITNLKTVMDRTLNARIPIDIIHGDIDHFEKQKDFTYDLSDFKGLPDYVDELKRKGIRFITILDPALVTSTGYEPTRRGNEKDVWIKWPRDFNPQAHETQNNNMLGYVWPEEKVLFPDFLQNKTIDWWSNEIKIYYDNTLKFSGLWIDMNEPANFGTNEEKPFNWPENKEPWALQCPNNRWDDPPYRTGAAYGKRLSDKTLCLIGEQTDGVKTYKHYDVHNLYGHTETIATYEALLRTRPGLRPLVITRSTFPGSGSKAGHWLGDNNSHWAHLKYNIIGLLEFNLFGIPYVGADTCGFFNDAEEELCERWMQLGAFNPFFRNHNSIGQKDQDPASYSQRAIDSMRKAVELRYTLIPHLYTLFYRVNKEGGTVARSLAHEFSKDRYTRDIDEQFMWGSSLLISPCIHQGKTTIDVYFPRQARWFDFYNGKEINTLTTTSLYVPRDFIPLHIRGGHIIPLQQSGMNTDESRKNPFELLIAPDASNKATGELYYDDGESLSSAYNLYQFSYENNLSEATLNIKMLNQGYQMGANNLLTKISIFDIDKEPVDVQIDSSMSQVLFNYDRSTRTLTFTNLDLSLMTDHKISIQF